MLAWVGSNIPTHCQSESMRFRSLILSPFCLTLAAVGQPAIANPPFSNLSYVSWEKAEITADDCRSQAATALVKAGLTEVAFTKTAVFGVKQDYEAYVYCIFDGSARIGVVGATGPDSSVSKQIRSDIESALLK
jgi:hypothetical protein